MLKLQLTLALILSLFVISTAQSPITVGEKCPPIHITDWIQNSPKDKQLENKIVIIDFWATWCGPCIKAVPHFNELVKEFKDEEQLIFLSMTYEPPMKIKRTLERIEFQSAVVTDQDNQTQEAFGIGEIPYTLIIKADGTLAWKGHPESLKPAMIREVLAGKIPSETSEADNREKVDLNDNYLGLKELMAMAKDSTIVESFKMITVDEPGGFSAALLPKLYYQAGAKLSEILSKFLNVPERRIGIPAQLKDAYFNIVFLNKKLDTKEAAIELMLNQMAENYGTVIRKQSKETDVYLVEIKDATQLKPATSEQSSISDAGDKIIYTAKTIDQLLFDLETYLEIPLLDHTERGDTFDFIIDIKNHKALLRSLRSYGLKLSKSREAVPYYDLELE